MVEEGIRWDNIENISDPISRKALREAKEEIVNLLPYSWGRRRDQLEGMLMAITFAAGISSLEDTLHNFREAKKENAGVG